MQGFLAYAPAIGIFVLLPSWFQTLGVEAIKIDYPISKPQPAELKKANKALKEKYKIESWPTILVLDAEGKILCRENGYEGDPAPQYTANLKKKLSR